MLKGVQPPILYGDHVIGPGRELFREICKQGGEGLSPSAPARPYKGTAPAIWLKIKCIQRQEFVIVGWSKATSGLGFRSLASSPPKEKGKLTYVGNGRLPAQRDADRRADGADEPLAIDKAPVEVPARRPERCATGSNRS
jgi:bifunctional non-homologous end joining protein LigD